MSVIIDPMARSSAVSTSTTPGVPNATLSQADFLKVMIAQLSNQDPGNAQDPNQFMNQFMQMGNFTATQQMSANMSSLYTQQQQMYANSLVGKKVDVTDANGNSATGIISSAWVSGNNVMIQVGNKQFNANSIMDYLQNDTSASASAGS